jgi:hypothetical protein
MFVLIYTSHRCRSGGMADAAVSKTVEGQPHVGSTPTFGITGIWQ